MTTESVTLEELYALHPPSNNAEFVHFHYLDIFQHNKGKQTSKLPFAKFLLVFL